MQVILPFPPKCLSPNARVHHMQLAAAKKKYRKTCAWEAKAQGVKPSTADSLHLSITFHPPDRRRRDLDNMLASLKSALDGLQDVLGVDDHNWTLTIARGEPKGCVAIHIEEVE